VVCSFEADSLAGAASVANLVDLGPLLIRDGIAEDEFIEATLAYTGDERGRWALPVLADTYGLLFNRTMFAAMDIAAPPRTLVEWYGRADLAAFHEQLGEEFSTRNAFQAARLAMCLDGEWRVAFIAIEADELDYGSAPLPVDSEQPELYGSGFINGSVIGIPR